MSGSDVFFFGLMIFIFCDGQFAWAGVALMVIAALK